MDPKPRPKAKWLRAALAGLLVVLIFVAGVNVGNGNLHWRHHQVARGNLPDKLDYSSVDRLYQSIKANYDGKLDAQQLEDGIKHGLAAATNDPYTVYFTAKEAKDFNSQLNNSFSGIGAQLGKDDEGNLEVIAPIDGFPAAKAGLKSKDIIVSVNGDSTQDMSIDKAVSKIRGPAGSNVKLQVVRNHVQPLNFTITRQDVNLPSVKTKLLDGNIGYIQISSFSDDTAKLVEQAARQFKQDNVNGLILDLRNNTGGLLNAAVRVSSLWLPQGQKILDEKQGAAITDTQSAFGDSLLRGIPTVVLINSGSASASEITAGALKDNNAAYLIGEKTYGKGVVQKIICVTGQTLLHTDSSSTCPGDELKVTVASWYRPNGQNINKKGITPDKTVKISADQAKADQDPQLQAALDYLKQ